MSLAGIDGWVSLKTKMRETSVYFSKVVAIKRNSSLEEAHRKRIAKDILAT